VVVVLSKHGSAYKLSDVPVISQLLVAHSGSGAVLHFQFVDFDNINIICLFI